MLSPRVMCSSISFRHQDPGFVSLFQDRIRHAQIRAAKPGTIGLSVGNRQVDFAAGLQALAAAGYIARLSDTSAA